MWPNVPLYHAFHLEGVYASDIQFFLAQLPGFLSPTAFMLSLCHGFPYLCLSHGGRLWLVVSQHHPIIPYLLEIGLDWQNRAVLRAPLTMAGHPGADRIMATHAVPVYTEVGV